MFMKETAFLSAVLFSLLISGCNNDIFIENSDLPAHTTIAIYGDGGGWSSPFSRDGLTRIYIDYAPDEIKYVTYYSVDGGIAEADCQPSRLQSIVYETPVLYYSIGFAGDMVYFYSDYNVSETVSFRLCFDYDYGVSKYIDVTIREGERMQQVSGWNLSGSMIIKENHDKTTHITSLTNNSKLVQKLEILPFSESVCCDVVSPADQWAKMLTLTIPMLTFDGQDWVWVENDDIRLGMRRNFVPTRYLNKKITVEVPPETKATVTYTLYYALACQKGVLHLFNPVVGQDFEEEVTWSSIYATHYDYTVKYE